MPIPALPGKKRGPTPAIVGAGSMAAVQAALSTKKPVKAKARRYPKADVAFFTSAIREAQTETLFMPVSLSERVIVRTKPQFDTACWAFLPPHRIYMGLDLFQKEMVKPRLSEERQRKYVANHYHHEQGHGLFTVRDMKRILAALKLIACPFPLYNLFEDAYMEDRYRRATTYRFEWLTMEDCSFSSRPESLLFALIQAEGDSRRVETELSSWEPKEVGQMPGAKVPDEILEVTDRPVVKAALEYWFPHVLLFYRRMTAATESMQLMPILKAWIDRFGLPPAGPEMSDLMLSMMLSNDPQTLQEFDKDTQPLDGDPSDRESGKDGFRDDYQDPIGGEDQPVGQKGHVLASEPEPLDISRTNAVAEMLKKLFVQKSRRESTDVPSKRISVRNYVLGRPYFRKETVRGRGKRSVLVIVDCSGSMDGHIDEGRILVAALSRLASAGAVEGHVIATGGDRRAPAYETYVLPVRDNTVCRMQARHGAENVQATLRSNLQLAKEADHVFVYTDANLTDAAVQKSVLHAHGIQTWGLYVGSEAALPALLTHFDKALIRSTVEELADAMLLQLK